MVYGLKFVEYKDEQLLQGHRKWKIQGFAGLKFESTQLWWICGWKIGEIYGRERVP